MKSLLTLKQKIGLCLAGLLLLLNVFTWQEVFALNGPHYLKVDVLDIGQGDSIFIETPDMRHILIDGGPDSAVLGKLAERLPFFKKSLDVVILTHPDQDHLMGLLYVLQKYKVDYIIWTGMVRDGANYSKWVALLEQKQQQGSKIIITKLGDKIKNGNVVIETLNPSENLEGTFFKEANDTGVVERLTYGKNSFLFTADIPSEIEQAMIDANINLASDVLKVGHHGSKYSSSETFLQEVNPNIAAISAGAHNTYGHPTQEVLQRLENSGITTLRTDQSGDVQMVSDGENIRLLK